MVQLSHSRLNAYLLQRKVTESTKGRELGGKCGKETDGEHNKKGTRATSAKLN